MTLAVGVAGTGGTARTVMEELAGEIQVGEAISLAVTVWLPTDTKVKVTLVWAVPPSSWYSYCAPTGAVITIVPVGTAQVGCTVTLAVGIAGTAGTALTVRVELAVEIQVGEATSLAVTVWLPTATKAKVTLVWAVPPSSWYSYWAPVGAVITIVPVGTAHVG